MDVSSDWRAAQAVLARTLACSALSILGVACEPSSPPPGDPHHDATFLRAYTDLSGERRKRYDPVSLIALAPNQSWEFEWPEHPEGRIVRATNELGLSEKTPTRRVFDGVRMLVAGDSHTEGVVWTEEAFPNVLERLVSETRAAAVDVLNAGVGYMGPYCYLGVLRKHLALEPDVFVATVFCGNDFMDDLRIAYLQGRYEEPRVGEDYYAPLRRAEEAWPAACWQGVNQAYRFKSFPAEIDRALETVEGSIEAIRDLCAANGIRLLVVLLPTKFDVDLGEQREEFRRLSDHLGLDEDDMASNERLGRSLEQRLRASGVDCLNVVDAFRDESESLYWRRDHHLNVRGHARLAELVLEKLETMGVVPPE